MVLTGPPEGMKMACLGGARRGSRRDRLLEILHQH